ncbi:hypothetical protein [Microbacterium sp. A93]|uniref:hypothetical protein n=1 Tax=Microbacterium sp. A93 TaxID=3450716 RepID=UPI003F442A44
MDPSEVRRWIRSGLRLVPPRARRRLRAPARALGRRLPSVVREPLRKVLGLPVPPVRRAPGPAGSPPPRLAETPTDPLGLATPPAPGAQTPTRVRAGRAAATVAADPQASLRLDRALGGGPEARPDSGGRLVGGLAAADLRGLLEQSGHHWEPWIPGTAEAAASRAEVVVLDLEAAHGVWGGLLDARGIALWGELAAAVEASAGRGVTCWLVDRGRNRHRIGAGALRQHRALLPVMVGARPASPHVTEDPGDAPLGILDLLRALDQDAADPEGGRGTTPTGRDAQGGLNP